MSEFYKPIFQPVFVLRDIDDKENEVIDILSEIDDYCAIGLDHGVCILSKQLSSDWG